LDLVETERFKPALEPFCTANKTTVNILKILLYYYTFIKSNFLTAHRSVPTKRYIELNTCLTMEVRLTNLRIPQKIARKQDHKTGLNDSRDINQNNLGWNLIVKGILRIKFSKKLVLEN